MKERGPKTALLAVAAVAAITAHANAEVVYFENPAGPDHFEWFGGGDTGIGLNVLLSADAQTGAWGDPVPSFLQYTTSTSERVKGYADGYDLQVAGSPEVFTAGVSYLESIPGSLAWNTPSYIHHTSYPDQVQLPVGVETYLGIRFPLVDGTHYGWIGVVMDEQYQLDAFAWGYETEPGVPIAAGVPAPGTAAVLTLGAAGLARRRRH